MRSRKEILESFTKRSNNTSEQAMTRMVLMDIHGTLLDIRDLLTKEEDNK